MKVYLFGEGNTDVRIEPKDHLGALAILLAKMLADGGAEYEVVGDRLPRLQRIEKGSSGFRLKVERAIAAAQAKGADAVAIVLDRDRDTRRIQLLRQGREDAKAKVASSYSALASRTAIGVAIEMLEAWLIADTAALACFADVSGALPAPESLPNPKEHINKLLKEAGVDAAEGYDAIAQKANLAEIEKRCRAFREFRKEVRDVLLSEQS